MIIDKEQWQRLLWSFETLKSNYDEFSDTDKNIIDELGTYIDDIEGNHSKSIYVITNNAVVDDDIFYNIYGVATTEDLAKQCFEQAIEEVKNDADFDNLNAINIDDDSQDYDQEEWYYDEDDESFELYLNGQYNSNNYSIRLLKYNLVSNKELDNEIN